MKNVGESKSLWATVVVLVVLIGIAIMLSRSGSDPVKQEEYMKAAEVKAPNAGVVTPEERAKIEEARHMPASTQ